MSDAVEKLESLRRQLYLKAHSGEYPFPLDGSEWARLVHEKLYLQRHPHCACESCDNFLTRLHSIESPLRRQRAVIGKAMHHWFLITERAANPFSTMRDQMTAEELAKANVVEPDSYKPAALLDAEKDWLSQKLYSKHFRPGLLEESWLRKGPAAPDDPDAQIVNQLELARSKKQMLKQLGADAASRSSRENPPVEARDFADESEPVYDPIANLGPDTISSLINELSSASSDRPCAGTAATRATEPEGRESVQVFEYEI